jgi:superfamily II DNA helicase RecQ
MAFSQKKPKIVNKNEMLWKEAFSNLKEYFGYTSFRSGQEAAIGAAFEKNDSLVVMATGFSP